MISPSAHEPCTFLNFQIHFSVFLLSLNLIVLFPNNEFCTITICFSFIFIFSLIMHACLLSCVQLFVTLWTVAHKVLLSMGLSGQQYWRGLPYPPPEDLPNPGIKPVSPSPELAGDYHWANWEVPYFTCCGQFCWVTLYIFRSMRSILQKHCLQWRQSISTSWLQKLYLFLGILTNLGVSDS